MFEKKFHAGLESQSRRTFAFAGTFGFFIIRAKTIPIVAFD
jgi:hypothetical protein